MNTPVNSSNTSSALHLLGHFSTAFTGAERELFDLQRLLVGRRETKLWSDGPAHPAYAGKDITVIQPFARKFPLGGTLLIAGVHVRPDVWMKYAKFERIIVFYNLANHGPLFSMIEAIRTMTGIEPELVFVSHMLQMSVGLPGRVIRSLMDLQPFLDVAEGRWKAAVAEPDRPLVVGRISRDAPDKHHADDPAFYRSLAARGLRVRIMGGTCLGEALAGVEGIELLPAGVESAPDFFRSLDIFFYRTGASVEAYGRVVMEAMAAGLPVVAHSRGGYAEVLAAGEAGYLFNTQEEAYDRVMALKDSAELRRERGLAAVHQVKGIHGAEAALRDLDFYLVQASAVPA